MRESGWRMAEFCIISLLGNDLTTSLQVNASMNSCSLTNWYWLSSLWLLLWARIIALASEIISPRNMLNYMRTAAVLGQEKGTNSLQFVSFAWNGIDSHSRIQQFSWTRSDAKLDFSFSFPNRPQATKEKGEQARCVRKAFRSLVRGKS